jgi:hypothetical protein
MAVALKHGTGAMTRTSLARHRCRRDDLRSRVVGAVSQTDDRKVDNKEAIVSQDLSPSGFDGPVIRERTVSDRGTAGALFAGTLMVVGGFFGFFQGLSLIAKGSFYVQPKGYWINTSASTWGWVLLIVGLIVVAAGFGVFSGAAWARWLGITVVSLQALTNFLFIPVQPWWAFTLILIDLWIIHSLFLHRREYV